MARAAILVIGDTQYLFDGQRMRPDLLAQTFSRARDLAEQCQAGPILHVVHVGDVTEHGDRAECEAAVEVMGVGCQLLGVGATVVSGNHDIDQRSDDSRGPTPFLSAFGAQGELAHTLGAQAVDDGATIVPGPGGYSSWQVLEVPAPGTRARWDGERLGVLGLDWRPSAATLEWADDLLRTHRHLPTILITHDVAIHRRTRGGAPCGPGELTEHGQRINRMLADHDQVFLVLGGHEWPSTRVVDDGGREFHAVNYQDLPYGGAGAARLYCLNTDRGECEVISFAPTGHDEDLIRSVAARRRLALARPEDQFRFALPPALGGGSTPWQARGLDLLLDLDRRSNPAGACGNEAQEINLPLAGRYVIELRAALPASMPEGWQVLLSRLAHRAPAPDGSPEPLAALSLSTENFVGWQAYLARRPGSDDEPGWTETWQTSHELEVGSQVRIVVSGGTGDARQAASCGLWVDGDRVGRSDGQEILSLLPGPWRWRIGAGEYGGRPTDRFGGRITVLRVWGRADTEHRSAP
ncbi:MULTISPECIES: metallophosphoesterase [Actinomyces]|uniref:Metallophosphoesterase n=1 Tax=Actinomyces respiraculi TaxID=2744574 RepID=A0A7T0LLG7_9ACTO|nr:MULTISPECIES: metallophosphoesterase [Actinomyces]QPL05954.1 metallophosphoesterase [Actinomyces respiraculi]